MEKNNLVSAGWKDEGIGWYAMAAGQGASRKDQLVAFADTFVGCSYSQEVSRRLGPDSFDCAGFVSYVFAEFGLDGNMLARKCNTNSMNSYLLGQVQKSSTGIQWKQIDTTDISQIEAGDIVLFANNSTEAGKGQFYHAGIGVKSSTTISAQDAETGVGYSVGYGSFIRIFRMTNI